MISDFAFEWQYWIVLLSLVAIGLRMLSAKALDFQFFLVLFLAQYVVHSSIAFGANSSITIFCTAFFLIFLIFARAGTSTNSNLESTPLLSALQQRWIVAAKTYLLVYYLARLALYPFIGGELLLDDRLAAQQDNPLIFTLGLAVQPALAASMFSWIRRGKTISPLDILIIAVVIIGLLGSGSKGGVISVLLTYVGVASYLNKKMFASKWVVGGGLVIAALSIYGLTRLFPDLELSTIASLIQYRVAANTDSVEYIYATELDPRAYPFSGVGALLPILFKRVGYEFEYPPGVWLHGMRFDNWLGFGPNSGIVMDYFGNLGWFGLLAAVALGAYVGRTRKEIGPIECSFLAMALMAVVDIGIFDISAIVWGGIYLLLRITTPGRNLLPKPVSIAPDCPYFEIPPSPIASGPKENFR